jgi:formate/nitrite transporter FocA (FNT family)
VRCVFSARVEETVTAVADDMKPAVAPEPHEVFESAKEEGERRLSRPVAELAATSFIGGADVCLGALALFLVEGATESRVGPHMSHLLGALAFGIGFVFMTVGRSELFTENFLIPVAAHDHRNRGSWYKLLELWSGSFVLNLLGGALVVVILTSHEVTPSSIHHPIAVAARHIVDFSPSGAFYSAIVAGALITLMTWLVEGAADSTGVRISMAWVIGFLIALGSFNHVIVNTIELIFGMRTGADVAWQDVVRNLGLATAGNMVGGIGLVTLSRSVQAFGARPSR